MFQYVLQFNSPHVRKSKTVLDSGFQAVDSGFPGTGFQSLSVEPWILDSNLQKDSGFHQPKFIGFQNPNFLTWGDLMFRNVLSTIHKDAQSG